MNYYAMQILTRQEKKFITLAEGSLKRLEEETSRPLEEGELLWPRRELSIRRRGKTQKELAPIFPGYLFFKAASLEPEVYWTLKKTGGFIRFLKSNQNIEPLQGDAKRILLHFLNFGEVVGTSKVSYTRGEQIVVVDGPMKGLEGKIKKVNPRKGRAKIELSLYEESFLVDFGFEIIEKLAKKNDD